MRGPALIRAYRVELRGALVDAGVPRRLRPRILAEVDDHLREAVAERAAVGEPATIAGVRAVVRFGEPRVVAKRFADELSPSLAWGATVWTVLAFATACLVWAAALVPPPGHSVPWAGAVLQEPLRFIGIQVCFVVALLTAIRALRQRRHGVVVAERMRFIRRGDWVLGVVVAALLAPDVAGALLHPAAAGASPYSMALTIWLAVAVAFTAAALVRLALWLPAPPVERATGSAQPDAEWALDDITAAARLVWSWSRARAPWADPLIERFVARATAARSAAVARAPGLEPWLSPREHPHRVCVASAILVGLAFAGVHGVTDPGPLGTPPSAEQLALAVLSGLILLTVEATAVVGVYALLGGFLGLRPRRRAGSRATREVPFSPEPGTLAHE